MSGMTDIIDASPDSLQKNLGQKNETAGLVIFLPQM